MITFFTLNIAGFIAAALALVIIVIVTGAYVAIITLKEKFGRKYTSHFDLITSSLTSSTSHLA